MKAILSLTIFFLLIPGCVNSSGDPLDETPSAKEGMRLVGRRLNWIGYWKDNAFKEGLVREITREFGFIHPGIVVNLKFPQEISGIKVPDRRVMSDFILNMLDDPEKEWDVIWLDDIIYYYVGEVLGDQEWGAKYLVNFDDVTGFPGTQKDFIINGKNYRSKTGGIIPGPYLEGFLNLFWFNEELAREIGILVKERGCSLNDFLGYLKKAREYSGEDITVLFETKELNSVNMLFQNLFVSEVGYVNVLRERLTNRKKNALLRILTAFEEMGRFSPLAPDFREKTEYNSRLVPLYKKVLFYPSSSAVFTYWKAVEPDGMRKMIPMEIPAFGGISDAALGGYTPTWAVFKDAPNKDIAIRLMKYIASPRIGEKWIKYTKNPTGIKGNLFNISFIEEADVWSRFHTDIYYKYGDRVQFFTNTAFLFGEENPGLKEEVENRLVALLEGRLTGKKAYNELMDLIDAGESDD